MRHGVAKAVALGLILFVVATGQQDSFFPMGVSLPATWNGGTSYLADVESLGANWAWFDCNQFSQNMDLMAPVFQDAYNHGIKLLLLNAGLGNTGTLPVFPPSDSRLVIRIPRPGIYNLHWNRIDSRDKRFSNAIYFLCISAPALTATRKLVIE